MSVSGDVCGDWKHRDHSIITMKERREVAMLKESAKNKDVNGAAASLRDIKEEVKEEPKGHSARNTPDIKPPSNKMANGEAGEFR